MPLVALISYSLLPHIAVPGARSAPKRNWLTSLRALCGALATVAVAACGQPSSTVPQGQYLGLTFPDPDMTFNEKTGHWEHGEIDWAEFKRVVAGDGPCNRQRIRHRQEADTNGAWVREAALAYAEKRRTRAQAAARIAAE